jgi:hypothetical protein
MRIYISQLSIYSLEIDSEKTCFTLGTLILIKYGNIFLKFIVFNLNLIQSLFEYIINAYAIVEYQVCVCKYGIIYVQVGIIAGEITGYVFFSFMISSVLL